MTRVLGAFLLAMLLVPGQARAGELTLRDVIELHRAGLGEALLIAVIEADGGPFTLSYAEILDLKSDGLSERVITALVRTGTRRASAAAPPEEGMVAPLAEAAPTVIVEQEVTQVAPTVVVLDTYGSSASSDNGYRHRRRDRDDRDDWRQSGPAPGAWVTDRETGRNSSGTGRPAAAWVTPNDIRTAPKGFHPGNQETPRRDEDRGSRSDDHRDDDRRDDRRPKP